MHFGTRFERIIFCPILFLSKYAHLPLKINYKYPITIS